MRDARRRRRLARSGAGGDAGLTLIEMTVAMSLLTTLMVMSTAGILGLFRFGDTNEANVTADSQLHFTFQRLDAQIRYATAISQEGTAPGTSDWYVEYLSNYTGNSVCEQLRLTASGLLQQRGWASGGTLPGFTTIASGISGTHPFTRIAAGADGYHTDRLTASVSAAGGSTAAARQITVTFAALNSSSVTSNDSACSEGRPT